MARSIMRLPQPRPVSQVSYGLIYPNGSVGQALDAPTFLFTAGALIPHAPATLLFRVNYTQQAGYYTNFFFAGNLGSDFAGSPSYIGCHPYPYPTNTDITHKWEISTEFQDFQSLEDVAYGVWYRQAVTIETVGGVPVTNYYYDIDGGFSKKVTRVGGEAWGAGGANCLIFGNNPWTNTDSESLSGTIRGLQQYAAVLSQSDIALESANNTSNTPVTAAGLASVWYMNQNPTPSDISDKSGQAHHPAWLNGSRPTLYTSP